MTEAETQRDAAYAVIRHMADHLPRREGIPPFGEWSAEDWEQSGWTDAEGAAIRAALPIYDDRQVLAKDAS